MKQKVLIIGKVWPEPDSSAAGSRMMQLIDCFQNQKWEIGFASAANKSPFSTSLEKRGVNEFEIHLNDARFDTFIQEYQPDMVLFDRFTSEEQFGWRVAEHCPKAIRVLDTEDLHCLRAARQEASKQKKEFTLLDLSIPIAYREIASIYRCDLTLIISEYELNVLLNHFKVDQNLLLYLPFMLDPISKSEIEQFPAFEQRQDFISVGNFLHEPNWDAVLYLKNDIWPLIRKQLPKANLLVYGAYPSHKVDSLNNLKEGFCIKGRTENMNEVMRKAKVLLAPLRFGAGLKGKFIDAMKNGTPSVTSAIGAEAMHANLPWCGEIQNETLSFAESAIKLYTSKLMWQNAQQNGVQIIQSVFSRESHEKNLLAALSELKKNLSKLRALNFTGAMLMQQSTQSSKYMALWIEAKNKQNQF